MNKLGDAPIEPKFHSFMNKLAHILDEAFNGGRTKPADRKTGFVLIVFPFDQVMEGGRANYISNAQRDDVVIMLKEQIKRFEGQPEVSGRA